MAHHNPDQHVNTIVSMISAAIAIIMSDVQSFVSITAGIVAVVAGFMSIRNSYYATIKTKKEIKKNE